MRQVWVNAEELAAGEPRALPAHRVWADALLREAAAGAATPDLSIRAAALLGRLQEGDGLAPVPVDAGMCALSLDSAGLPLFRASVWTGPLRKHLQDLYGQTGVDVEEHLLPCTPGNRMTLRTAPEAVADVRADLRKDVAAYFETDVAAYLLSWRPLPESGDTPDVEVVVPWSALPAPAPSPADS